MPLQQYEHFPQWMNQVREVSRRSGMRMYCYGVFDPEEQEWLYVASPTSLPRDTKLPRNLVRQYRENRRSNRP